MAKFYCPHCMMEYNKNKVQFYCASCDNVVTPPMFYKEPLRCYCGNIAAVRRCPSCEAEIPRTVLQFPYMPFSIIGVSNSGKSNYITVMLNELSNAHNLNLSLSSLTPQTEEHQKANYNRIYIKKQPVASTRSGSTEAQIWCIRNLNRKTGSHVYTSTFTIYDSAGEDIENHLELSSPLCRYINQSRGIILCLDPLILPGVLRDNCISETVVRNSLGGNEAKSKNSAKVVNDAAEYIKTIKGISPALTLDLPVAIVLTKFDTLLSHPAFAKDALVKKHSMVIRDGVVSRSEITQIHDEIIHFLREIGEGGFINALNAQFKDYSLFGVSSFGAPPRIGNTLNDINPHRVLDPMLWLLKKFGFVD